MNKLIDSEKLIAEIERRIESWTIRGKHSPAGQGRDTCDSRVTELSDLLSFITSLQQEQPSLPSNLDEAALKAYPKMSRLSEPHGVIPADNKTHYLGDANEENRVAFKAGAEWMAGQGVSYDCECIGVFQRAVSDKMNAQFSFKDTGLKGGDKVVVQIRKK